MAYRFIDHTELSGLIKQGAVMGRDIAVVDVRGASLLASAPDADGAHSLV